MAIRVGPPEAVVAGVDQDGSTPELVRQQRRRVDRRGSRARHIDPHGRHVHQPLEWQAREVRPVGIPVERTVDVRPGVPAEGQHVDREGHARGIALRARLPRQERVDLGNGQTGIGCHPLGDRVAQVHEPPLRHRRRGGRRRAESALVRLLDEPAIADPNAGHHQQPQVAHDGIGDPLVRDVRARDVEPEILALQPATVGELDLEIEGDPVIDHRDLPRGRSLPLRADSVERAEDTRLARRVIPPEEGLGPATNRRAEVVELVEVGDLHVRAGVPVGDLAVADERRRVRLPRVEQHRRAFVADRLEAAVVHRECRRELGHDAAREAEDAGEAQIDADSPHAARPYTVSGSSPASSRALLTRSSPRPSANLLEVRLQPDVRRAVGAHHECEGGPDRLQLAEVRERRAQAAACGWCRRAKPSDRTRLRPRRGRTPRGRPPRGSNRASRTARACRPAARASSIRDASSSGARCRRPPRPGRRGAPRTTHGRAGCPWRGGASACSTVRLPAATKVTRSERRAPGTTLSVIEPVPRRPHRTGFITVR